MPVELGMRLGRLVECRDLVVEHTGREVTADRALVRRPPPRGAATVGHHHPEALVGEPL